MLALDGLLQQVVSEVTSSDPTHNPDETTLQARAMIRRKSYPLLGIENGGQDQEKGQEALGHKASISNTPIAGMAASSLERLDELARKVDQLAVVATEQQATPTTRLRKRNASCIRKANRSHHHAQPSIRAPGITPAAASASSAVQVGSLASV